MNPVESAYIRIVKLQARVKAIAEIVGELVAGVKEGRDVDLNNVKREVTCL